MHSRRLLEHAAEMIAQGDRIAGLGEDLGLPPPIDSKKSPRSAAGPTTATPTASRSPIHISDQVGDPEISNLFAVASDTHQNFYEDRYELNDSERPFPGDHATGDAP